MLLNEFLIDDRKKNALIISLKEIKAEVATLGQETTLTEAEEEKKTSFLRKRSQSLQKKWQKRLPAGLRA